MENYYDSSAEQLSLFDLANNTAITKVCKLFRSKTPLTSQVTLDEFTQKAQDNFDYIFDGVSKFYPFEINDTIKNLDFQILVICGASGTGKSTFSRFFGEQKKIEWDNSKAIISHFNTPQEATEKLIASGLSSIPVWCKPRNVLSIGEGFRCDIARQLNDNCVIDEFTSNVDRNVALSCAKSIGSYIRKHNLKRCVFVSCHKDFIDLLCPDYVIDLDDEYLYDTRRLPLRKIELSITKGGDKEYVWNIFRHHHYMTQDLNNTSTLYTLFYKNTMVACCYVLSLACGSLQNAWRIHRLVVNPDYQGLGIGTKFLEAICDLYSYSGGSVYIRTSHIKLRTYFNAHTEKWLLSNSSNSAIRYTKMENSQSNQRNKYKNVKNTIAYSYKYIGECGNRNLDYSLVNGTQNMMHVDKSIKQISLFDI